MLYIISLLSFTILIILQIVFITYLKVDPSWDFGEIFNDSYEAATGVFELKEYYYKFYPNNIGILLFFTVIFKVVNLFTINKDVYLLGGMIVNIIMINGSLLAMYILIKKGFNLKGATLFSVFCLFSVPLFTYAPIFYTDTITMIFPVLDVLSAAAICTSHNVSTNCSFIPGTFTKYVNNCFSSSVSSFSSGLSVAFG